MSSIKNEALLKHMFQFITTCTMAAKTPTKKYYYINEKINKETKGVIRLSKERFRQLNEALCPLLFSLRFCLCKS